MLVDVGLSVELFVGVLGIAAAVFGVVKWYTNYKVKEKADDTDIQNLLKRVESLETDIKNMTQAGVQLSNNFHAEINQILHKIAGDSNAQN